MRPKVPLNLKVPRQLHESFKSTCALNGTTMTSELIKHMNEYVSRTRRDIGNVVD